MGVALAIACIPENCSARELRLPFPAILPEWQPPAGCLRTGKHFLNHPRLKLFYPQPDGCGYVVFCPRKCPYRFTISCFYSLYNIRNCFEIQIIPPQLPILRYSVLSDRTKHRLLSVYDDLFDKVTGILYRLFVVKHLLYFRPT